MKTKKRTLASLLLICLCSSSMFADIPANGSTGYFYNSTTGKFLSHGVTSVSKSGAKVDHYGIPVTITNEGTISEFDDADYNYLRVQMADYVGRYLRVVAAGLDCGGSSYHKWAVKEIESGKLVFRCIYTSSQVGGATQGYYIAIDENDGLILVDGVENAAVWEFIDAATQISLVAAQTNTRLASVAEKAGISASNQNELETALAGMTATDMTSNITNPTMYENTDGWTVNNIQGTAISNGSYQIQNAAGTQCNCSQTVSGLPSGIYKLTVQTFYRASSLSQCVTYGNNGYVFSNAYVKANDNQVQIKDWYAIRTDDSTPNSRSAIKDEFNDGEKYTHTLYCYVGSDGNLDIEINVPSYSAGSYPNWICFNNVTLTYYASGEDLSPYETALASVIAKAEAVDGLPVQAKIDLTETVNKYNNTYTSVEAYNEAINAVNEAIAKANNVVSAYTAYKETKQLVQSICDQNVYTDENNAAGVYADAVASTDKLIDEATLEECENTIITHTSDIRKAMAIFLSSVTINEGEQFDITNLLVNPQLLPKTSSTAEGWTHTQNLDFGSYQITQFPNASSFNIYQTIEDMPEGNYTMTVRAFHRPGAFSSSDMTTVANTDIPTYVYVNDKKVTVKNICEGATTNIGGASTKVDGETIYIPNSRGHLTPFLSGGYYLNTVNAKVGAGDITIGLAFDSWVSGGWGIVTDFHLYYKGNQEETFVLNTYEEIASQALDRSDYDKAVEIAKAKVEAATSDEELANIQEELRQALCVLLKEQTTENGRFDISTLIQNGDFSDGNNGWTGENAKLKTANEVGYVGETSQKATVSQILKQMPAGHYTLYAQTFYRPTDINKAAYDFEYGNEQVIASLFIEDKECAVPSLFDGRRADNGTYCIFDGRSVPNSASAASTFFGYGEYWNMLDVDIAEDRELKLGLKIEENTLADNWLVFDNFKLFYGEGKVADVTLAGDETINMPVVCNVVLNKTFSAGAYTPLCVPFEVTTGMFDEIYMVGGVNGTYATLYPVSYVKPNTPCVVKSNETKSSFVATNVILSPVKADTYILPWDGGMLTGLSNTFSWRYVDLTNTEKSALALKYLLIDSDDPSITVNLESLRARAFINNVTYTAQSSSVVSTYNVTPTVRRDLPAPVAIPLPIVKSVPEKTNKKSVSSLVPEHSKIIYSEHSDMSDAKEKNISPNADMVYLTNLNPQKTYYYLIENEGVALAKGTVNTTGRLRMVYAPSAYNIRDLGGWLNEDGKRVNYGHIYRGSTLNGYVNCTKEDLKRLEDDLGVGAEIDLRYMESYDKDAGCGTSPFGYTKAAGNYYFAAANDYLASDITNTSTQKRWKEEFEFICNNFRKGNAVYFHCAWGADRTGLLALLLEGLLGLELDQIYKDYELTSFSAAPGATNRLKTSFQDRVSVFTSMSGATLGKKVENYFLNSLGVSQEDIDYFREVMLSEDFSDEIIIDEMKDYISDKTQVVGKATLIRTLEAGKRNVISLPFSITRLQATKLMGAKTKFEVITGFDSEGRLKTGTLSKNTPNIPFLITPVEVAEDNTYVFENVELEAGTPYISTFTRGQVCASYNAETVLNIPADKNRPIYVMRDGRLYLLTDSDPNVIHGTDGYFIVENTGDTEADEIICFIDDDYLVGIDTIQYETSNIKEGIYTISGQKVNQPTKGLYIIDGKKVVVK